MDIPDHSAFDPDKFYEIKTLAIRWGYDGGTKNLAAALEDAGAQVVSFGGKGVKLVRFKPLCE
jgi:hypothetical protein